MALLKGPITFAPRIAWAVAVAFTIACSFAVAPARARQASDDPIVRGDELAAALDNAGAVEAYETAMTRFGEQASFDLRSKLTHVTIDHGMDLAWERDLDIAEPVIARGLELAEDLKARYPGRAEAWLLLAMANGSAAQFRSGKEKVKAGWEIESYCKEAIRLDPEFSIPYIALGKFYREVAGLSWLLRAVARALYGRLPSGTYQQSLEMLEKAIALDPNISIAHYEHGATLYRLKRNSLAEAAWRRALEIPPQTTRDLQHNRQIRRRLGIE